MSPGPADGHVHSGGDGAAADVPRGHGRVHQEQRHGQVRGRPQRDRRGRPLRANPGRPRPVRQVRRRETLQVTTTTTHYTAATARPPSRTPTD